MSGRIGKGTDRRFALTNGMVGSRIANAEPPAAAAKPVDDFIGTIRAATDGELAELLRMAKDRGDEAAEVIAPLSKRRSRAGSNEHADRAAIRH